MKKNPIIVTNINKLGGVISDPSEAFDAHTERPSAPVIVRKAALLVSALWLMSLPLTFASCSEDELPTTSENPDTDTRTDTPDAATDSTTTFGSEISDWKEGKGELTPVKEEKGGAL